MPSFLIGFIGVVAFIALAPALQFAARRLPRPLPPVICLAIAAVVSHLAGVVLGVMTMQHFQYWNAASIFSFGVMGYVFAFGAVYKSVSIEILLDLAERDERRVPLSDIVEHKVPDIFRGRTDVLVDSGLVKRAGSSFVVTAAGQKLAGRIARLRRLFAIGDTGLYDFAD